MKVLVTGGAGFIGSHIVDTYLDQGHEVTIVDNLSTGSKDNINNKANFIEADITTDNIKSIISDTKPEVINHHAAQISVTKSVDDPKADANINILGTINLLEAAKSAGSVKKIIFASTGGAIYGDASKLPTSEANPALPVSPYGVAKLSVEHYLYYYQEVFNLPFISLRYSNVYGPRQNPHGEAGVVAIFFQKGQKGEQLIINGNGDQTRDFIFVADVARANTLALNSDKKGIFNIGTSTQTSINQLTKEILENLKPDVNSTHGPAKAGEQQTSCLDFSKAKKELNWQPQVSLQEGLKLTAQFFLT